MAPGAPALQPVLMSFDISGSGWDADDAECEAAGSGPGFQLSTNTDGLGPETWTAVAPSNLTGAADACPAQFTLSWDAVGGASAYSVFRSDASCEDAFSQQVTYGTTTSPTFTDLSPDPVSSSYYAIDANETGTGCTTERVCIQGGCICDPPAEPENLIVDRAGDDLVLTWDEPLPVGLVWNVYRDSVPDPAGWGLPLHAGVADSDPGSAGIQLVDPGAIQAGSPLFYLVTTDNGCAESPLF